VKKSDSGNLAQPSDGTVLIASWNVNGIRAVNDRGDLKKYLASKQIDILCLNETKVDAKVLDKESPGSVVPKEYIQFWNCCKGKKGYSGVAIFSKIKPLSVKYDIGKEEHDQEGRTITLEFDKFYLVSCYVPNAGQKLEYFGPNLGASAIELSNGILTLGTILTHSRPRRQLS